MPYELEHQSSQRAALYHEGFQSGYDGYMWTNIEIPMLANIFSAMTSGYSHADLACGTGRIVDVSSEYAGSVTGFDISHEMLEIAQSRLRGRSNVRLVQQDLRDSPSSGEQFDIVTAFRLYLNAEDDIRRAASEFAFKSLKPGGLYVANIHCLDRSLMSTLYKLDAQVRKFVGKERHHLRNSMSVTSLEDSLIARGFVDVTSSKYGHLPRLPVVADRIPPKLIDTSERILRHVPALGSQFALVTARRPT